MEPEILSEWFPVFRDFAIIIVALFLLVYEAVFTTPNQLVIGALGAILVGPAFIRFHGKPNGNGKGGE